MSANSTRRELLHRATLLGAAGLAAAAMPGVAAAASASTLAASAAAGTRRSDARASGGSTAKTATKSASSVGRSCVLAVEQTEGPYYLDIEKVRSDLREGKPGVPLQLAVSVVDASGCRPVAKAAVDIWHCDADGVYSGVDGDAGTFMRGTQLTNASGVARFTTVYPGWYPGRTVHIHVKVHAGGNEVHTGQVYFDDKVTDAVYRLAPYKARGERSTRNTDDGIFFGGGSGSVVVPAKAGGGYAASVTLGVRRS